MTTDIEDYNNGQAGSDTAICTVLASTIDNQLTEAESKIWHGHPVWFLEGNPIVGYSKLKAGIRLMFWSGASFEEEQLKTGTGKFKDGSITYTTVDVIDVDEIGRWLKKSKTIQWDYKNVIKRKGVLVRLK